MLNEAAAKQAVKEASFSLRKLEQMQPVLPAMVETVKVWCREHLFSPNLMDL